MKSVDGNLFLGFSKLDRKARYDRLVEMGALTPAEVKDLTAAQKFKPEMAENFIENVIGYFQMPLGVAANFRIDGCDVAIPMAVEETSIIAALSKTARWIRNHGEITTEIVGNAVIGQIQIAKVKDFAKFKQTIETNRTFLIETANEGIASGLVKRGGGVTDIQIRRLDRPDRGEMAVLHVLANTCDAMGANIITQICEYLKTPIENLTGETVTMCILSNLGDQKLTCATVRIRNVDPALGQGIEEASIFAETDPYRAATHNKGALNGMDPIIIATGNDWRAVEAGVHAYACRDGQYRSITRWRMQNDVLEGTLEAPIHVGTVGGVTKAHPTAQLCLSMMGIESSAELSRIIAAVGLAQNLGAITALTTFGFIQGHMKLHITNLSISAGAKPNEIPLLKKRLEELLAIRKNITLSNAIDVLRELRRELTGKKTPQEQTV